MCPELSGWLQRPSSITDVYSAVKGRLYPTLLRTPCRSFPHVQTNTCGMRPGSPSVEASAGLQVISMVADGYMWQEAC